MVQLNKDDHSALEEHGLSISQMETQLQQLRQGVPALHLVRPCVLGDGVSQLSPQQTAAYHQRFRRAHAAGRVSKFIPASGAATRMFKDLLQFLDNAALPPTTELKDSPLPESVAKAWEQLHHFPFIENLQGYFKTAGINFQNLYHTKQALQVFEALLHTPGLGYAHLPKALLPFHQYPEGARTSLEEHVHEAIRYAHEAMGPIRIHLTVSAQFETQVMAHFESIQQKVSQKGVDLSLTVSIQKPSTDTIALDSHEQPFRDNAGQLVFRPGGHGALLENLNDYRGDIVSISNIDNVVPDHLKDPIIQYRMSLTGYLIELQEKIFHHLKQLELQQPLSVKEAQTFIHDHLQHEFPQPYDQLDCSGKATKLKQFLNRPLRVCGVVANTGDPGGGPFWVQDSHGSLSRQIVEQSQADPESTMQQQLFQAATHFNPVDMICAVRDYQDNPFNLLKFRDPATSFISNKTYQGRPLKALEWPGLWNGSMADWITLFVEVPRSIFNPVKTFLDWLHPHHQPPT